MTHPTNRLLLVVEATFLIRGTELAVLPGFRDEAGERFRIGDPVLLKRPEGSDLATTIGDLARPTPNPNRVWLLWFNGLPKDDVPVGTEVWSMG